MVGMHLTRTRGGITTLTAGILASSLKDEFDFVYIAAQAEEIGIVNKFFMAIVAWFKFVRTCLFKRPDLVYVHLGSNASMYREGFFVISARLFGLRVLSHYHAGDIQNYYPNQPRLGKWFIRKSIGMSSKVIAVSEESARQLLHLNDQLDISLIPNAIDISTFLAQQRVSNASQDKKPVKLLFVGAVGKLKGEHDLIEALLMLKREGLNIRSSFVGYGADSLKEYLEKHGVLGQIDHLGPVPMAERHKYYEDADIFALPTYAEAMPIAVIEAMAAGMAIVSTRVGGIPEIITDGTEGFLVESGDVKALAEKIKYLAENKETRLKLSRNARQRCKRQMDFTVYLKKIRREMHQACGNAV